jgi:hypothetical protein
MRVAIIVLGVLLCSSANGEPQSWMKSDDPDTLRYMADVKSCPISEAALDELVKGILIRSRLKPQLFFDMEKLEKASQEEQAKYFQQERFGFSVYLKCTELIGRPDRIVFDLDVSFVRWLPIRGRLFSERLPYGSFGVTDEDRLKANVKEAVERLVTDYLKANFALTPE